MDKRNMAWLWLVCAATCGIIGKTGMRAATENHLLYVPVLSMIVLANTCLFMVMKTGMELGTAYALWSASGIFIATLVSIFLYGETINSLMVWGLVIITISVFVIEHGNKTLHKDEVQHP